MLINVLGMWQLGWLWDKEGRVHFCHRCVWVDHEYKAFGVVSSHSSPLA